MEQHQERAKDELEECLRQARTHMGDQTVRTFNAQRQAQAAEAKIAAMEREMANVRGNLETQAATLQKLQIDYTGQSAELGLLQTEVRHFKDEATHYKKEAGRMHENNKTLIHEKEVLRTELSEAIRVKDEQPIHKDMI